MTERKELIIQVILKDGSIGTAIQRNGFDDNSSVDRLAIIGALQNLIMLEQQKFNVTFNRKFDEKGNAQ